MNIGSKLFISKIFQFKLRNFSLNSLYSKPAIINRTNNNYLFKRTSHGKIVGSWLLTCSGMVYVAVALGGVTRLTESGLSMVTWKFLGENFPTNQTSWKNEFEKYKEFPEFKILNKNMTLEEFKRIWWMEYIHRMWGRLIGVSFIVPASYFWLKNMLNPKAKRQIALLGCLIGCQGLMGWYMVKSGLENSFDGPADVPRVSQYRLAAHLSLALIIYSIFLHSALDHLFPVKNYASNIFNSNSLHGNLKKLKQMKFLANSCKGLVFLTAVSGAFVAGLDAGLIYNTFPKMAGKWIPDDIWALHPTIKNFTENPTMVQLQHRTLGILTLGTVTYVGFISRRYNLYKRASKAASAVVIAVYLQATLGITTLLNHVPTLLAAAHQSVSVALLSMTIWLCHEMKYIKKCIK